MRIALSIVAACVLAAELSAQGLPPPPVPPQNPITPAKTSLGRVLFWDEQLSSTRTVACGSCHVFSEGGSDPRSSIANPASVHPGPDGLFGQPNDVVGSPGVPRNQADEQYALDPAFRLQPQVTGRRSMSVVHSAYPPLLFWDGRAGPAFTDPIGGGVVIPFGGALEAQVIGPPTSSVEMAHEGRDWNDVAARVAASQPLRLSPGVPASIAGWIAGRSYPELFAEAFGTPEVTPVRIAMAIATYERTLIANQTPFDAFLAGNPGALTPLENQGRVLFNSPQASCNVCHGGPRLTDEQFHYTGVRPQDEDLGRFLVTGNLPDRGRMRTPSLRNVELRGPYFHNGRFATLADVVDFYDRGGDFDAPNKPAVIRPLGLTPQQKQSLVAFLSRPLTDPRVTAETGPFERPALYATSANAPSAFGVGTPGTGGFVPDMIALEPGAVGVGAMTIAVDRGMAGRQAILAIDPVSVPLGVPFQGATLYLGLSPSLVLKRIAALQGSGPGGGWGSLSIAVPSDPVLIGTSLFAQWFVFDPQPGQRFSASRAVEIPLF